MLAMIALVIALTDEFERLEGKTLAEAATSAQAIPHDLLTFNELGTLPNVLRDSRKAVVIVKTDEGNMARLVASPGFRRPPKGGGEPFPVILIERLETMEAGPLTRRIARARDLVLFDGFLIDLDSGQVVPAGQGGDLQFLAGGPAGPRLLGVTPLKMLTFTKSPLPESGKEGLPSPGRNVTPTDFEGRFHIISNGQTSGTLELTTGEQGSLTGRMTSDQTGSSYKVSGKAGHGGANRIEFSVELPRTRQDFEGFLFTDGKAVICGSYAIMDRRFGFLAIREGSSLAVDGEALSAASPDLDRPGKLTVLVTPAGFSIEGKSLDEEHMVETIRDAVGRDPATWVLLKLEQDLPVSRVLMLSDLARSAGAATVRVSPPTTK